MRIRRWLSWGGAGIVVSCLLARPASADPAAQRYVVTVTDDSVGICLSYSSCGSAMLRQDVDGGAVVRLAGSLNANERNCYVDECVPPGTYRYGCETPLPCACSSPPFWEGATVTVPLDAGCTRRPGDDPPTPVSAPSPWTGDEEYRPCSTVCTSPDCDSGSDSDAGSGGEGGARSDAGSGGEVIISGCGCSSARSVFVFDGSVLFLALALLGRRRWRARQQP
jgi:hypothetical protein